MSAPSTLLAHLAVSQEKASSAQADPAKEKGHSRSKE